MFDLLSNIGTFITTLVDGFVSFFDFVLNVIPFLLETITSLIEAVGLIFQAIDYVTGFSVAVPSALFTLFLTMTSLSIIFFIVGRVK